MRQVPEGSKPSMWQRVGTLIPARVSVCRIVAPFLASMVWPFASMANMAIPQFVTGWVNSMSQRRHRLASHNACCSEGP